MNYTCLIEGYFEICGYIDNKFIVNFDRMTIKITFDEIVNLFANNNGITTEIRIDDNFDNNYIKEYFFHEFEDFINYQSDDLPSYGDTNYDIYKLAEKNYILEKEKWLIKYIKKSEEFILENNFIDNSDNIYFIAVNNIYIIYKTSNDEYVIENLQTNNIYIFSLNKLIEKLVFKYGLLYRNLVGEESSFPELYINAKNINNECNIDHISFLYDYDTKMYDYMAEELQNDEDYNILEHNYLEDINKWFKKHIQRLSNYPSIKTHHLDMLLAHHTMKTSKLPDEIICKIIKYLPNNYL